MAEDVASRVAGAEALPPELRERAERAAARLGSIHERWSTSKLAEPTARRSRAEDDGAAVEHGAPSSEDDGLSPARDGVSVTPILGIETDESDEAGRPRFKTLMGVPRSSPELDELAGLDSNTGGRDTVRRDRPAQRPPAVAASSERVSPHADEAPSLAGTSLPWEPGAPPSSSRRVSPQPWPSLAESSLDVSAEVAALRRASRRRPWWLGLGIAAAAAVFAILAPRQRSLALGWLESEYRARLHPTAVAISDTARALRPGASTATSSPSPVDRATAQLEPPLAVLPRATGESAADAIAEDSRETAMAATLPNEDLKRDAHASGSTREPTAEASASLSSSGDESGATKSKPAAHEARSAGTTSKARAQVAAPRKPLQRSDNHQTANATNVVARSTKARATRQNTPRKDGGSGIIRETPF